METFRDIKNGTLRIGDILATGPGTPKYRVAGAYPNEVHVVCVSSLDNGLIRFSYNKLHGLGAKRVVIEPDPPSEGERAQIRRFLHALARISEIHRVKIVTGYEDTSIEIIADPNEHVVGYTVSDPVRTLRCVMADELTAVISISDPNPIDDGPILKIVARVEESNAVEFPIRLVFEDGTVKLSQCSGVRPGWGVMFHGRNVPRYMTPYEVARETKTVS